MSSFSELTIQQKKIIVCKANTLVGNIILFGLSISMITLGYVKRGDAFLVLHPYNMILALGSITLPVSIIGALSVFLPSRKWFSFFYAVCLVVLTMFFVFNAVVAFVSAERPTQISQYATHATLIKSANTSIATVFIMCTIQLSLYATLGRGYLAPKLGVTVNVLGILFGVVLCIFSSFVSKHFKDRSAQFALACGILICLSSAGGVLSFWFQKFVKLHLTTVIICTILLVSAAAACLADAKAQLPEMLVDNSCITALSIATNQTYAELMCADKTKVSIQNLAVKNLLSTGSFAAIASTLLFVDAYATICLILEMRGARASPKSPPRRFNSLDEIEIGSSKVDSNTVL